MLKLEDWVDVGRSKHLIHNKIQNTQMEKMRLARRNRPARTTNKNKLTQKTKYFRNEEKIPTSCILKPHEKLGLDFS